MKTYLKTLVRAFKKHITRFISIVFIVLVSVGFVSGIGTSTEKLKYSLTDYYKAQNVSDLIVKCKGEDGFSAEHIERARALHGEKNIGTGASVDAYVGVNGEKQLLRLYFFDDFDAETVNVYEVLESTPLSAADSVNEARSEVSDNIIEGIECGTEIELDFKDILTQLAGQDGEELPPIYDAFLSRLDPVKVTVSGVVKSPLTFANDGEPSWKNPADMEIPTTINGINEIEYLLDNILYMPYSAVPEIFGAKLIKTTDMYVSFADKSKFKAFDKDYKNSSKNKKQPFWKSLNSPRMTYSL